MVEDKLLTLDEVVKYFKIPKSTLYKLVERKALPSCKIGKQLRFRKSSLDKWLTEQETGFISPTPETTLNLENKQLLPSKSQSILLIDDDPLVLKAIAKFLKTQGYNIELAQSGEEALSKVENLNFDLIIADIRMPGIDGIETINRIRQFYQKQNKPLLPEVIITGYIDPNAQAQAQDLGITDYIYKPFAIGEFIKTVKEKLDLN